ncbi:MAG TPA: hypothetical protein P5551_11635 [Syntrophales bacterium]|nr:hypothetical protein [Syntrophales bacterium]
MKRFVPVLVVVPVVVLLTLAAPAQERRGMTGQGMMGGGVGMGPGMAGRGMMGGGYGFGPGAMGMSPGGMKRGLLGA